MPKDVFHIQIDEGRSSLELELDAMQVQDMLLDGDDALTALVIIEVLARNHILSKKVQHFLNSSDKDAEVAHATNIEYITGRPVYEVPVEILHDGSVRPDIPQGVSFFWSKDKTRVFAVPNYDMAEALGKQETARYIGVVGYSVCGIGQDGWEPND